MDTSLMILLRDFHSGLGSLSIYTQHRPTFQPGRVKIADSRSIPASNDYMRRLT